MNKQIFHLIGSLLGAIVATGAVYSLPLDPAYQHMAYTAILMMAWMLGINLPPPNSAFDPKTGAPK